jgi:anti-anti-sigma factor
MPHRARVNWSIGSRLGADRADASATCRRFGTKPGLLNVRIDPDHGFEIASRHSERRDTCELRHYEMSTNRSDRIDTAVVHVDGPLRGPTKGSVRRQVLALLSQGRQRIVLSLSGVTDLDAEGIGELVRAYNATLAAGAVLRIADAQERVRDLLRRVQLLDLLEDESTIADEDESSAARAGSARH